MKYTQLLFGVLAIMLIGCSETGTSISPNQTVDQCLRNQLYRACMVKSPTKTLDSAGMTESPSSRCDHLAVLHSIRLREYVEPACRLN